MVPLVAIGTIGYQRTLNVFRQPTANGTIGALGGNVATNGTIVGPMVLLVIPTVSTVIY